MQFEAIIHSDLIEVGKLQPDGWSDILPSIRFYLQSPFCYPIKAQIENELAGIGAAIVFHQTSWLAHIIVAPKYHNRGIGSLIVKELLKILSANSVETISLIATELGKPVYLKAGFRILAEYTFLEKVNKWTDTPISTNVVPYQVKYRDAIFKLDQVISGEERTELLAPVLDSSSLFVRKDKVLGYFLPDLKEGLINAETDEAGLALMNLKYGKTDKAVLPAENRTGISFLKQSGFAEVRKGSRMIQGKELDWNPQMMFSRIGGNLG